MIKKSLLDKLAQLGERHEELSALLSDSGVIGDQNRFRAYSREYAEIGPVVAAHAEYLALLGAIREAGLMARDADAEIRQLAEEEIQNASARRE